MRHGTGGRKRDLSLVMASLALVAVLAWWPTVYLIDKQGFIRYTHIGEGSYVQTEQQIQTLLTER